MTPTTIAAGWVLIGVSLIVLGAVWLRVAVSERAERKAVRDAEDTARVVAAFEQLRDTDPFTFSPDQQAAYDAHVRQALQAVAAAPVVPLQREAGRWS